MSFQTNLAQTFAKRHPVLAVRVLEKQATDEAARWMEQQSSEVMAQLLSKMTPLFAASCVEHFDFARVGEFFSLMDPVEAASILRRVRGELRETLLGYLSSDFRQDVDRLLVFSEGQAGALIDPQIPLLMDDMDMGEARKHLKSQSPWYPFYYVIDRQKKLLGGIALKTLLEPSESCCVSDRMQTEAPYLSATLERGAIVQHPDWSRFLSLAVVDKEKRCLGVVTLRNLYEDAARSDEGQEENLSRAGMALGELYWVGLTGLFEAVSESLGAKKGDNDKS